MSGDFKLADHFDKLLLLALVMFLTACAFWAEHIHIDVSLIDVMKNGISASLGALLTLITGNLLRRTNGSSNAAPPEVKPHA